VKRQDVESNLALKFTLSIGYVLATGCAYTGVDEYLVAGFASRRCTKKFNLILSVICL